MALIVLFKMIFDYKYRLMIMESNEVLTIKEASEWDG